MSMVTWLDSIKVDSEVMLPCIKHYITLYWLFMGVAETLMKKYYITMKS